MTTRAPAVADRDVFMAPWNAGRRKNYRRLFLDNQPELDPGILEELLFDDRDFFRYEFVGAGLLKPDDLYALAVPHAFLDCMIWYSDQRTHHGACLIVVCRAIGLREDCGYLGWWDSDLEEEVA